jgi:NAD(P)-dependent dehydrogenase (short-subunit alcohol dehydrogenase family)
VSQQPRVALVVGAGDYIGAAIAKRFAAGGFTVALGRRHAEKLEPLVAEIAASGGAARAFALDARDEANVQEVFATVEKELGPEGIHVAHLVIDAGVDTAFVRERIQAAGRDPATLPEGSLMNPASIGETYWLLHQQPRDAWTFELDLRPHRESW